MIEQGLEPNIQILNSMLLLHAHSLRTPEMESMVLPLYEKYKVKHDIYTYQHLLKAYLNVRENDTVLKIYDRLVTKEKF